MNVCHSLIWLFSQSDPYNAVSIKGDTRIHEPMLLCTHFMYCVCKGDFERTSFDVTYDLRLHRTMPYWQVASWRPPVFVPQPYTHLCPRFLLQFATSPCSLDEEPNNRGRYASATDYVTMQMFEDLSGFLDGVIFCIFCQTAFPSMQSLFPASTPDTPPSNKPPCYSFVSLTVWPPYGFEYGVSSDYNSPRNPSTFPIQVNMEQCLRG